MNAHETGVNKGSEQRKARGNLRDGHFRDIRILRRACESRFLSWTEGGEIPQVGAL